MADLAFLSYRIPGAKWPHVKPRGDGGHVT